MSKHDYDKVDKDTKPTHSDIEKAKDDKNAAKQEVADDTRERKANEYVDAQKSARAPVPEGPKHYAGDNPLPSDTNRNFIGDKPNVPGQDKKHSAMTELRKYHDELIDKINKMIDVLSKHDKAHKMNDHVGEIKNTVTKIGGVYDQLDPGYMKSLEGPQVAGSPNVPNLQNEPKI